MMERQKIDELINKNERYFFSTVRGERTHFGPCVKDVNEESQIKSYCNNIQTGNFDVFVLVGRIARYPGDRLGSLCEKCIDSFVKEVKQ